MTDFKVGDKVTHNINGAGELTYGPFIGGLHDDAYLFKKNSGPTEFVVKGSNLTAIPAIPAFAVGNTVAYEYGSGGKLVAGPFKSEYLDEPFWVVETAAGFHFSPTQSSLTKAEAVDEPIKVGDLTLPPGYDHAGKRYEYGAEYRDIDGDRWFFEAGRDGMPVSDIRSYSSGRTLESVVRMHGPIDKV